MKTMRLGIMIAVLLALGAAPAGASVIGAWDVGGDMTIKIAIKGEGADKQTEYSGDVFEFSEDGSFAMTDMNGTWVQNGSKFIVTLDANAIELLFESLFADDGLNVDVEVAAVKVKGNESQAGDAISGTMALKLNLHFIDFDVPGKVKMNYKFEGTRLVGLAGAGAGPGAPDSPEAPRTLIRALGEAVRHAVPAPRPQE